MLTSLWVGLIALLLSVSVGVEFSVTYLGAIMASAALGMLIFGIMVLASARTRKPLVPRLLLATAGVTAAASVIAPLVGASNLQLTIAATISVLPLAILAILAMRERPGSAKTSHAEDRT
ncbi:putative membrane protein [Arthrobacter sp. CAN_C5]|nr:putative membrane protein [Arthrobacter sp. CAN_C5]